VPFTLNPEEIKVCVEVGFLAVILGLETLFPLFQGWQGRWRHVSRNIFLGLMNVGLLALLFSGVTAVVASWGVGHFGLLSLFEADPWFKTVVAFLLFDAWMYAWHRANHQIHFLWRFHRMHHTDDRMDTTSAIRFHPVELIYSSLVRLAVIPLLGISLEQVILYETILQPVILFHHSNVALPERIDRIFRAVIVTPNMHRVHHSDVQRETDSNYSTVFSIWDRLFGSFRRRTDTLSIRYGLTAFRQPAWQSFLGMLKTPLKS